MANELNQTPTAERVHIGFFGKRNAGKSSVINAITGQNVSIVSNVKGTTTDPVYKTMELLPLGPVAIIDTPGIDDFGTVGELRVQKTKEILKQTDIAVLVVDSTIGIDVDDNNLIDIFKEKSIPYVIVYNKCDLQKRENLKDNEIQVSAIKNININELKNKITSFSKNVENNKKIIGDLLKTDDIVVLVTPIDSSAPKGRLILPQVQTIRDILDSHCISIVTQTEQLKTVLNSLSKTPAMVVTDSQEFAKVKNIVPDNILLTSFSILFARYKGILETSVLSATHIDKLQDNDIVLIAEGCTHHRQCDDIGTVKIPKLIKKYTGKNVDFEFCSGKDFPNDLSKYSMVIHCGGCMINEREVESRRKIAEIQNIPFTNYGTSIAYMNGILRRSLQIFPDIII